MSKTISVLLVDDHVLLRQGLAAFLANEPDIAVVDDVGDGRAALLSAMEHKPSVVIMDVDMPGQLSFETARAIRERLPQTKVLFLSAFAHDRYVDEALRVGGSGYLTKTESSAVVAEAIRNIARGFTYYSSEVRQRISTQEKEGVPQTRARALTEREVEVLRYLGAGYSRKEIAAFLFVSEKTVENHITHVMRKLDLHDRVALARYAIREGYAKA